MKALNLIAIVLVFIVPSAFVSAQTDEASEALLFDSYAQAPNGELRARLDNFLLNVQESGEGTRGLAVIYGKPPEVAAQKNLIEKHIEFRRAGMERYEIKTGGNVSDYRVDLYIIKKDQKPPTLKPEAYIFGEVLLNGNPLRTKAEEFFAEAVKLKTARGYIINYGSAREIAKREKTILEAIKSGIHHDTRITMMSEPDKHAKTVFWFAPVGAEAPMP